MTIRFADCVRETDYGLYKRKIADCVGADCPLLKLTISEPYIGRVNCFDMLSEKAG